MIRVSCKCGICKINAAKVGASFPLSADIPETFAVEVFGTTDTPARPAKRYHGTVYSAHDPSFVGEDVRRRTGIAPVA